LSGHKEFTEYVQATPVSPFLGPLPTAAGREVGDGWEPLPSSLSALLLCLLLSTPPLPSPRLSPRRAHFPPPIYIHLASPPPTQPRTMLLTRTQDCDEPTGPISGTIMFRVDLDGVVVMWGLSRGWGDMVRGEEGGCSGSRGRQAALRRCNITSPQPTVRH